MFNKRFEKVSWLVFAGLLFSCAANRDWATRIAWPDFEFSKLPTASEFPNDGAVILLDEGRMETFLDGDDSFSIFERHRIVKIFRPSGKRFANVVIPYVPGSEVRNIRARTISPNGKISILKPEQIYDVSLYPNFVFYSDQRAKIFTFPSVDIGCVLEYQYEINIQQETIWHAWQFQSDMPTLISRFVLTGPATWELNYRTHGTELEPFVMETPSRLKKTYSWEMRNVPSLKVEYGMPPVKEVAKQVTLSPLWVKSWEDVTKWYHDLTEPQLKVGKELQRFARELTDTLDADVDKVRVLFEWVRDHVRYIAVSIGIGGYQPHPADFVFENQYGDCKDMATLLCAMARSVGIPAHEVIISTWQNGVPDTSLPSPYQFNHVISFFPTLGDEGLFLDATDKGIPFGQLPWYAQGLPALIVGEEGKAQLIVTPRVSPQANRSSIRWAVNLEADGSARIHGRTVLSGAPAADLREFFLFATPNQQRNWLEGVLTAQCSGAILEDFQVTGVQPVVDSLVISYRFSTRTMATRQGNQMFLRPFLINALQLPNHFRQNQRTHPIRFNFGFVSSLSLAIALPKEWRLVVPAGSDSVVAEFGRAAYSWEQSANRLIVHSRYLLNGEDIQREHYPAFQQFLEEIRTKDLTDFVFGLNQSVEF